MDDIEEKIHRLSQTQLHILLLLAKSANGIISPSKIFIKTGKALGGVISSLSRRQINGESLIQAWGRNDKGQLRWKLNSKLITQEKLLKITKELLAV